MPATSAASIAELERAARLLLVRSRREVTSAFAGCYRSAFRGGGMEFEESRPYAPGDDVRSLDWNAMARTGAPYVKQFREERDQTVVLAVDTSRSMAFGSTGRSKAALAAHAAALLAGAARRVRDRVGLLTFDREIRAALRPARSDAHLWRMLRMLQVHSSTPSGDTDLSALMARLHGHARSRSVVVILSDFRDEPFFQDRAQPPGGALGDELAHRPVRGQARALYATSRGGSAPRAELVALARRHDVVAAIVDDPRDAEVPAVGTVRIADPERPGRSLLLRTGSRRARERYRLATAVRRAALERRLRDDGADVVWLRTDREPLRDLAHFFQRRAAIPMRGGR